MAVLWMFSELCHNYSNQPFWCEETFRKIVFQKHIEIALIA